MDSETKAIHHNRGLTVFLGILLILGGLIALSSKIFIVSTTVYFFGWVLLIAGIGQFFGSFFSGSWSRFFLLLLTGVFSFIVGAVIIVNPAISIATVAIIVGVVFMVDGLFKIASSIALRTEHWGWNFVYGMLIFIFGIYMMNLRAVESLWIIGFLIGFQLIFSGILMIVNEYSEPSKSVSHGHGVAYR